MTGEVDTEDNKSNGDALAYFIVVGALPSTPEEGPDWKSAVVVPSPSSPPAGLDASIGEALPKLGILLSGEESRNPLALLPNMDMAAAEVDEDPPPPPAAAATEEVAFFIAEK